MGDRVVDGVRDGVGMGLGMGLGMWCRVSGGWGEDWMGDV